MCILGELIDPLYFSLMKIGRYFEPEWVLESLSPICKRQFAYRLSVCRSSYKKNLYTSYSHNISGNLFSYTYVFYIRNHVCEICGRGFVNKKVFQTHMYRHNTGEFPCSQCSKVFDTRVKWRDHERATHVLRHKRSKCAYCGERCVHYTTT